MAHDIDLYDGSLLDHRRQCARLFSLQQTDYCAMVPISYDPLLQDFSLFIRHHLHRRICSHLRRLRLEYT